MPSSFPEAIPLILSFLMELKPKSILDVGIGFGKWGLLFREYLDLNVQGECGKGFDPKRRLLRLDGLEAYAPYVGEHQRAIYDTIYLGEALSLLPQLQPYDLVFGTDILEHFTKEEGWAFVREAEALARQGVLLVTPAIEFEQGPIFGNPYEIHRSVWTPDDFAAWPLADVLVFRRQLLVYLPRDGVRRLLPRPTFREGVGIAARAVLRQVFGEVRSELILDRLRRRGR
ncbi:MAG: hypothetical protein ACK4Z6_02365 [Candidatus Methylomirabilales bacterium]